MWAILMIVLFFSAFAGIIYLINRIGKFGFLNKITKGKKWLRILISAVLVGTRVSDTQLISSMKRIPSWQPLFSIVS